MFSRPSPLERLEKARAAVKGEVKSMNRAYSALLDAYADLITIGRVQYPDLLKESASHKNNAQAVRDFADK